MQSCPCTPSAPYATCCQPLHDPDDSPGLRWLGLDVKRHADAGDGTAVVEFVARYKIGGAPAVRMHEVSRFVREDGRWSYVDGEFPR